MCRLSQRQAGVVLGYSKRNIQKMEMDLYEIRDGVALGCAAYALGIRDYNGPDIRAKMEQAQAKGKQVRK